MENEFTKTSPTLLPTKTTKKPFSEQVLSVNKADYIELKWKKNYWETLFKQHSEKLEQRLQEWENEKKLLNAKITELQNELDSATARIRDLTTRLYGKKSEKNTAKSEAQSKTHKPKKNKGQQPGSKGHGRTKLPNLPVIEEFIDLKEDEKICSFCQKPYQKFPKTEDSEIAEINVKAHLRKIKRLCYKTCSCQGKTKIITAPKAPRLLPKTSYGVSIWNDLLLQKFYYGQPIHRICENYKELGLTLPEGTVAANLQKLLPLFQVLQEALYEKQMTESLFNTDETGWKVFEKVEGKSSQKWFLWLTRSESVIYFVIAPNRSAEAPLKHFSEIKQEKIIVVCDRYSSYKKLARLNKKVILAFCWAHIRRDFLDAAGAWPELESWVLSWVDEIGLLYHLNKERLFYYEEGVALNQQEKGFLKEHKKLCGQVKRMNLRCKRELDSNTINNVQFQVLESLKNHWSGATVFVENPQVPMDNNSAEESLRRPVNGRKDYYGSGSVASANLTAILFSVFQTLSLWGVNLRHWLYRFLTACAENEGRRPENLSSFLPWEMDEKRIKLFSSPLPEEERIDTS